MTQIEKKRKSSESPENSELSKKEKRLLKSEEKKLQKHLKTKTKTVQVVQSLGAENLLDSNGGH